MFSKRVAKLELFGKELNTLIKILQLAKSHGIDAWDVLNASWTEYYKKRNEELIVGTVKDRLEVFPRDMENGSLTNALKRATDRLRGYFLQDIILSIGW